MVTGMWDIMGYTFVYIYICAYIYIYICILMIFMGLHGM